MKEKEIDYSKMKREDLLQLWLNDECEKALANLDKPGLSLLVRVYINHCTVLDLDPKVFLETAKEEIRKKMKPVEVPYIEEETNEQ